MHANDDRRYPIPIVRNLLVIASCSALYFALLYVATRAQSIASLIACGVMFAVTMIPVYSLIHEAEHNMLHPHPFWNDLLGRWLCMLFIAPFSFFKHCHLRHHSKNRTDVELWDLYQVHQSRWKRAGTLYSMMGGLGYLSLWLSVLVFAIAPRLAYCGVFQRHPEIAGFLEGSNQDRKVAVFRWESWVVLLFQATTISALHVHLLPWLTVFLIHGFVWSSQNYVNHAFSPRDVINGAHNLTMPRWLTPIYLNFNLHLAHHQHPRVPWTHLPRVVPHATHPIGFFRNYLRLWRGPQLTHEKNPSWHAEPAS
jgi:fatty acid desaturase